MENFPIEELELGVRSYNCLKRVGIETIGDLVSKTETELAAIPNFGKKWIEEVKETLAAHGLTLEKNDLPPPHHLVPTPANRAPTTPPLISPHHPPPNGVTTGVTHRGHHRSGLRPR